MKTYLAAAAAISLLLSTVSVFAQVAATAGSAPDLAYKAVPNFFKPPAGDYMGETQGVATNSKGDIFIFFRGPQSRLWEFDKTANSSARSARAITASCSPIRCGWIAMTISGRWTRAPMSSPNSVPTAARC